MQSIAYVPGSNGAGNASQMTVQTVRAPGASDILVNTVTGAPNKFYGSMGAPHTFTDPVTNETITIISEATAVDFAGHIDSGKVVIDAIAPGYTDTRGSLVGDIVVIRPVTEWANNLFNILGQAHNDNGSLKTTSLDAFYKPSDISSDFVKSGGVVAISSGLIGTFSDIVYYVGGLRYSKTGVANKTYTASKDTYVDIDAAGTVYYTEVANGATSGMALTAGRIRVAKVTTNGSAITRIDQNGWDPVDNPIYNPYPVIPPMVQDSGILAPSGAGWQYIKMRPGYKRVEIEAHYLSSVSTNAQIMAFGFNNTNSGTPPSNHYLNDAFISNTATVGRDTGLAQPQFARCYSNASGIIHANIRCTVDKNNSQFFGTGMVATAYEEMHGTAANNWGSDWLQLGWLAIYNSAAGAATYTVKYYR